MANVVRGVTQKDEGTTASADSPWPSTKAITLHTKTTQLCTRKDALFPYPCWIGNFVVPIARFHFVVDVG
jgi:hypothetical protein